MRQTQTLRRGPESLESLDQAPPPADTSKPHPLFLLPSTTGAQGCWSHPRWMVSIIRNRAPPVHFLATVARADDQYAGSAPHICCSGAGGRRLVIMAAADVLFTRRREAKRQQRGLRLCFNLFLFLMHLSLLFPSLSHLHGVCALQSHTHGWVCDFQRGGARKRAFKVMSVKVKVILDGCRLTSEGYRIWWGLSPAAASAWTSHTLTFELSSQRREKLHASIRVQQAHTGLQSPDKRPFNRREDTSAYRNVDRDLREHSGTSSWCHVTFEGILSLFQRRRRVRPEWEHLNQKLKRTRDLYGLPSSVCSVLHLWFVTGHRSRKIWSESSSDAQRASPKFDT